MSIRAEIDRKATRQGRALVELVRSHFPAEAPVSWPSNWLLVGPGLIARATESLEAILALAPLHRDADAAILLRSLYEHVTTFAWLSANPCEERMREWDKSDVIALLRMDVDCQIVGEQFLSEEDRSKFEQVLAKASGSSMPSLLDRATAADAHWSGKIAWLHGSAALESFRGVYAVAYRATSAIAHPSSTGLDPVMTGGDDGRTVIQLDKRHEGRGGPFAPAIVVYALGLHVCCAALGWPAKDEIDAILEH
jgi:Family of unknown function (DUF5677)